jgi:hypothetical protein
MQEVFVVMKDNIIKLKDVSTMDFSAEDNAALAVIAEEYASGAVTQQEAFEHLVAFNVRKLQPYTEERKSGLKLVQGSLKKLGVLLEGSVLATMNLSSSYLQPSRQLAKARIEGTTEAFEYVTKNLTEVGDTEAGDLPGPTFAPSRLIVSMRAFREEDEEKNPFEVDEEQGLMLRDKSGNLRRFGSLSIEDIKTILRTGKLDPAALDLINTFLGEFTPEGERAKPGQLGRFIEKLRKVANGSEVPDSFSLDICEALETLQVNLREATIKRNREERALAESEADMARQQRRLERAQKQGAEREVGEAILTGASAGDESDED